MQRALDLDMVTKERDAAKALADGLRGQRLKEFMEGFGIISMKLKEMYQVRFFVCFVLEPWTLKADSLLPPEDDHSGRKRRTGTGRFARSLLGRYRLLRHASQEELEKHL